MLATPWCPCRGGLGVGGHFPSTHCALALWAGETVPAGRWWPELRLSGLICNLAEELDQASQSRSGGLVVMLTVS